VQKNTTTANAALHNNSAVLSECLSTAMSTLLSRC